ncbi:hypothetical protein F5Y18DRAFT_423562 [Xylariaceae sp. FL1019]|nr:hypothetical protein F5Y18DRAFT_423562 [Xylariaceae sp. FL1019]
MDPLPSILRIPRELRLKIYRDVMLTDVKFSIIQDYKDVHLRGDFAFLQHRRDWKLVIPWVNLKQTCKQINAELSDYINSASIADNAEYRTYVLEISAHARGRLSKAIWRRIPCHPASIKSIEVYLGFKQRDGRFDTRTPKFWGDGGPMRIVSELYQTMNLLLHNGPILDRTEPLPHHLSFESLIVNIQRPELQQTSNKYDRASFHLSLFMRSMQRTGLLHTYVDRFRLIAGDYEEDFEISAVDNPGVPAHWAGYGFAWGLPNPWTNEVGHESHEST